MKPTQEQVEAALKHADEEPIQGFMNGCADDCHHMELAALAEAYRALAARDAERDARWEAFVAAWDASFQLIHECGAGRFLGFLDPVRKARAALADLGAEEKPCQCGNPVLRWVHQQPPLECGKVPPPAPKPEPKCGECGGSGEVWKDENGIRRVAIHRHPNIVPCPSCSKGPR